MKAMRLGLVVMAMSSVLLLQGCRDFWGGGWTWSSHDPRKKVTLGFEGSCDDSTGVAYSKLSLTYHDYGFTGSGVYGQNRRGKKHMAIYVPDGHRYMLPSDRCVEEGESFEGHPESIAARYCPQGVADGHPSCGYVLFTVADSGKVGPDKGDIVSVILIFGHYDGYVHEAEIQGGNVSIEF